METPRPKPHEEAPSTIGLLNLGTTNILDWIILCGGGCPGQGRMLSSVPGLSLPHASKKLLVVAIKNFSRHCHVSPRAMGRGRRGGGTKSFSFDHHCSVRILEKSVDIHDDQC